MFLAHINDVAVNFNKPLLQYQKKKTLLNDNNDYKLTNNICPHQGSLISSDTKQGFTCQYHGWSWNHKGSGINAGSTSLCNNTQLSMSNVQNVNNLLFSKAVDLSAVNDIDLSFMQLTEERIDIVNTEFENIIDVFLDVDHIPVVHSGLYDTIGISGNADVEWKYYDWGNIQLVNKNINTSKEFQETLLCKETGPGAFWITVYPYSMLEWQPGAMFITVCSPKKDKTEVVVFKYRDTRYSDANWRLNSEIWETAWQQDKHQAESIVARCYSELHLEKSKLDFRQWVEKHGLT
jgi:phenylpropionate dioxygenase-like ring-hydroxylating dioxygenase large terminal subunit